MKTAIKALLDHCDTLERKMKQDHQATRRRYAATFKSTTTTDLNNDKLECMVSLQSEMKLMAEVAKIAGDASEGIRSALSAFPKSGHKQEDPGRS